MKRAFHLAVEAYEHGEVPIGCVIVKKNKGHSEDLESLVVGHGRNRTNETFNATRHAEMEALEQLWSARNFVNKDGFSSVSLECVCYVTVEPCIMCLSALRELGVREIVFGCHNERFGGCGSTVSLPEKYGSCQTISSRHGLLRNEAILLLRKFYLRENVNGNMRPCKYNS